MSQSEHAICNNGHVGQVVILVDVNFGENSKDPLAKYPQPSVFTIVEKKEGQGGYYLVRDSKGEEVKLQDAIRGDAWEPYLYNLTDWLVWKMKSKNTELDWKDREIAKLKGHVDLLSGILTGQGFRIVTEEVAKELGINERPRG